MPLQQLLFSFHGRIGRQTFWIWNGCYYLFIAIFILTANRWFPHWAPSLLPLVMLMILLPDLAVTAKRWHDRDKSSWWLLLNLPLILGRMSVPVGEASLATSPSWFDSFLALAALSCGSWILVECGFLAGTQGDNRFGKNPVSR
ncbi:DUF805 domain-containing protein [Vibrio cincinnatiensis]|jgi:uncharacterized membrane protein YhaH (DUF805 family)|uniref:Uncharacterized membrane protein YhaH, DUF805 family n=1 Tax=Vibrio cincinnatiensis DSM 19608 TaxID=1123491 RepID=A0A1T4RPH8_VIBCI|nr:DUF805 domain-containing protein [Vibrio cincinnatiensis]MCG3722601.1 DUF805 domain-containing protein [Vibrio cincinnatiensis]MCG3725767.1 DUF805 domain-containing protein [Vibrio cincinnatiensis]MCG3732699.1 DUF805 domain-containing protein [Vibrio cincinnatiensis]MCG3736487.1 DUF805 domain-containing protein [Vibrio cincinnatiensis]MCG3740034.1 DUF805 domain-containing protein [Vibrio cincinnatiensis]